MTTTLKKLEGILLTYMSQGEQLKNLTDEINKYNGSDWKKYCKFCSKTYKKNLVCRNDLFEIVIICWDHKQKSQIHDHPNKGCSLKLLKGKLKESLFSKIENKLILTDSNIIGKGDQSYLEGKTGLHSIENISETQTISLHIYSPPNYKSKMYI
jgi:cysteine dioxygenase